MPLGRQTDAALVALDGAVHRLDDDIGPVGELAVGPELINAELFEERHDERVREGG